MEAVVNSGEGVDVKMTPDTSGRSTNPDMESPQDGTRPDAEVAGNVDLPWFFFLPLDTKTQQREIWHYLKEID